MLNFKGVNNSFRDGYCKAVGCDLLNKADYYEQIFVQEVLDIKEVYLFFIT